MTGIRKDAKKRRKMKKEKDIRKKNGFPIKLGMTGVKAKK